MKHDASLPLFSSIQTSTGASQKNIGEKVDRLQYNFQPQYQVRIAVLRSSAIPLAVELYSYMVPVCRELNSYQGILQQ